jgi:hypothetical protein
MKRRKGITQAFDAGGAVTADERWRFTVADDGTRLVEAETTRIQPFPEPRVESFSALLDARLRWARFDIHARSGEREAGIAFADGLARLCWRAGKTSAEREFSWRDDCEVGYNSALFSMMIVWRAGLAAGATAAIAQMCLHPVTFAPSWSKQMCVHRGSERRETRFGRLALDCYEGCPAAGGTPAGRWWCDGDGVIYEYLAADGSGYRLAAVNNPVVVDS